MTNTLEIQDLKKFYGSHCALDSINLKLPEQRVLGLLGPNGSGKTTLLKIIAGILRKSDGVVLIDGQEPGTRTKAFVSYLPDRFIFSEFHRIQDSVLFFQSFFQDFDVAKANRLLDSMQLDKGMQISHLSKGMQDKLSLCLVLSRKARLYLLDEPLAGIDPVAKDYVLDAMREHIEQDSSMVISTHLVRDIERIFDEVAFLSDGELLLHGNAKALCQEKNLSIDGLFKELFKKEVKSWENF